ncbi:MBL fold metallo-hydrolase [Treponema sp. OMZ 840]|uniref:MBL fold metallo-hydrolase n=1 Tax=Treponema sp. OMZ 840 TaxID=244313 RepID=UPI003D8B2490
MTPLCFQTGPLAVNTYIVPVASAPKHVFIVDPGGDEDFIISKLAGFELAGIVLSHGHFDHLGAVPALKKRYPAAPLCIHKADADYIGKNALAKHRRDFDRVGASYLICEFEALYPEIPNADIFFDASSEGVEKLSTKDDFTLAFAPEWRIIHTPGHSPGSICLYNKAEKILLSGDTLFASSCGRTDLAGGNVKQLKQSLALLLQLPADTRVCPGHGDPTTIGKEQNTGFDIYFV